MLFYTVLFFCCFFCIKWPYKNIIHFPRMMHLLVCFEVEIISTDTVFSWKNFDHQTPSLCFDCRILENNGIHQVSPMTFSGLNSLVLLWACFIFYILALCPAAVSLLGFHFWGKRNNKSINVKLWARLTFLNWWKVLEAVIRIKFLR